MVSGYHINWGEEVSRKPEESTNPLDPDFEDTVRDQGRLSITVLMLKDWCGQYTSYEPR